MIFKGIAPLTRFFQPTVRLPAQLQDDDRAEPNYRFLYAPSKVSPQFPLFFDGLTGSEKSVWFGARVRRPQRCAICRTNLYEKSMNFAA